MGDDVAARQARLALEGRAFPFFVYDPDGGKLMKDRLTLKDNPALQNDWPTYPLELPDESGELKKVKIPMTFADFAASEGRFKKHFNPIQNGNGADSSLIPFHEFLELSDEDREGRTPFIWTEEEEAGKKTARKLQVGPAIVKSAEERLDFWHLLKDLAGKM